MRETALAPVAATDPERYSGLEWVDRLKGVAMLWVVVNHIVEQLAGTAYAADPTGDWPPLAQRIAQFRPVSGFDGLNLPLTLARDFGWLADQAVSLFIILSGFGLTLGLLARNAPASIDVGAFVRRRLSRIYPMWWVAHALLVAVAFFVASNLPTGDWQFYASFAGLRFLPDVFSYAPSSWWYVGLIVQLYVVFPLLWQLLRRHGPGALLSIAVPTAFAALALGHAFIGGDVLEMWQRGMCCLTRLGEFAFGMALAAWWARDRETVTTTMRRPVVRYALVFIYAGGVALTFTLPGMIVAPTLLGITALVLLYPLMAWRATGRGLLEVVGRHSFSIYLAHQYFVNLFVRPNAGVAGAALGIAFAVVAATLATLVLERATSAAEGRFATLRAKRGTLVASALVSATVAVGFLLSIALDATLRPLVPAAEARTADLRFGATPATFAAMTPLRAARRMRMLVAGDTSVTATATARDDVWPRLVAREITSASAYISLQVERIELPGTPERDVAILSTSAQQFRPSVVILPLTSAGIVVNNGSGSVFALPNLKRLESAYVVQPLVAALSRPDAAGTTVAKYFAFVHAREAERERDAIRQTATDYRGIAGAAATFGAPTVVTYLPAAGDACGHAAPEEDRSQRRAIATAAAARLPFVEIAPKTHETPCPVTRKAER